jgi:DNA-binding IclR family transcriptional regulator
VWGNHGPTIVHWEESPSAVTVNLRLGDVMPLLSSATGRCFAAYASKEAIAPLLREEIARAQRQGRQDLPTSMTAVRALLDEVRARGAARVVDVLMPGIVGFCVPVFDADGHMALGLVALGPNGVIDPAWDGAVHSPLREAATQLSGDLGWRG